MPKDDIAQIEQTYEILALRHLQRCADERWVEWATMMLGLGFDSEPLVELAGEAAPFHWSEMNALIDRVFENMHLSPWNRQDVLTDYVSWLGRRVLRGHEDLWNALRILRGICTELEHECLLNDFYLLCYAKEDIEDKGYQSYWRDVDSSNIEAICLGVFREWVKNNPYGQHLPEP